jgi:hypothetical protein
MSVCQGNAELDVPIKSIRTINVPVFGIASSDAKNRRLVADIVCDLVARMIAELLITKEICSIVKPSDLPLNNR